MKQFIHSHLEFVTSQPWPVNKVERNLSDHTYRPVVCQTLTPLASPRGVFQNNQFDGKYNTLHRPVERSEFSRYNDGNSNIEPQRLR